MADIADYVIESDDELYSSRNEKITNEKEPKKYNKYNWIMNEKFESEAEAIEYMKQHEEEWGARDSSKPKIGVKKYYRCKNFAVRSNNIKL